MLPPPPHLILHLHFIISWPMLTLCISQHFNDNILFFILVYSDVSVNTNNKYDLNKLSYHMVVQFTASSVCDLSIQQYYYCNRGFCSHCDLCRSLNQYIYHSFFIFHILFAFLFRLMVYSEHKQTSRGRCWWVKKWCLELNSQLFSYIDADANYVALEQCS